MTAVLFLLTAIGALAAAFFFQGAAVLCVTAAVISAALFVFDVFLFKGLAAKKVIMPICAAALLCFCFFIPNRTTDYGFADHLRLYTAFADAVTAGKTEKAAIKQQELTEKYGEDDGIRCMLAINAIAKGNIGSAEEYTDAFSDKGSMEYYLLKEEIMLSKYVTSEELRENVLPLYIEASNAYPEWSYAAKNAGGMLFDNGEYAKASYYLTRALASSEDEDAAAYYYLGACLCEQGEYEKGLALFDRAVGLGVDDDTLTNIAWYVQQSGLEGAITNEE